MNYTPCPRSERKPNLGKTLCEFYGFCILKTSVDVKGRIVLKNVWMIIISWIVQFECEFLFSLVLKVSVHV